MKTVFKNYDRLFRNLGNNLMIYRTKAGLTQRKLGEMLGYSQATISSIERMYKDRHATFDFCLIVCDFFEIDLEDLLEKPKKKAVKKAIQRDKKLIEKEVEKETKASRKRIEYALSEDEDGQTVFRLR